VVDLQEAAMTRIGFLVLLAVIPALAHSQAETGSAGAALQGWSVEQLCDSREREDVRDELERRDLFSSRELRAIRDGEVKRGISLGTLICGKGPPASVVEAVARTIDGPVAAYIYPPGEAEGLVAYVVENGAESAVVHVIESDDPQAIVRNPSLVLGCGGSARSIKCRMVEVSDYSYWPRAGGGVSGTVRNGLPFPGGRCGERLCDANVENPPSQATLPLPPVRDDAQ
jgi:hypothetical protein